MADVPPTVNCGDCGRELAEDPSDGSVDARQPCPDCGSTSRNFKVWASDTIVFRTKIGAKARHPNQRRPFHEQVVGADLHRKSGKWMHKERIIDRENDWYSETVTDPETGDVIYECHEPLSEHQGHGSAKRTMGKPPESEPDP